MTRRRAGFSIIELLIVIIIIGVVAAFAAPKMAEYRSRSRVRSAQTQVYNAVATARNGAIRRGRDTQFIRTGNRIVVRYVNPASSADTIVAPRDLDAELGITLARATGSDTLRFDARGMLAATTACHTFSVTYGSYSDTITVTRGGLLRRGGCLS